MSAELFQLAQLCPAGVGFRVVAVLLGIGVVEGRAADRAQAPAVGPAERLEWKR